MTRRRAMALGVGMTAWRTTVGAAEAAMPLPASIRLIQGNHLGSTHERYGRAFTTALMAMRPSMRVVIEPMPRANGRLAARQLMEAPPDGATIGSFQTSLVLAELLGDDGVAFETSRFGWIGSFNLEPRVLVVSSKLGIASLSALRAHPTPIPVGAETTASVSAREPLLLNALLGTRLLPVAGYSSPARSLALVSGEIGAATASIDAVQPLIVSGDVRVVLRLDRHPLPPPLDDVPALHALAGIEHASPIFKFLDAHARLGRWLCMPPNAAPARLAAWRAMFTEIVASEMFQRLTRDAGLAAHGSTIVPGPEIDDALAEIFRARTSMAAALKTALSCGLNTAETGRRSC